MFQLPSLSRLYSSTGGAPTRAAAPPPAPRVSTFQLIRIVHDLRGNTKDAKPLCEKFRVWSEENQFEPEELWRLALKETFGLESKVQRPPPSEYSKWKDAFYEILYDLDRLNDEEAFMVNNSRRMNSAQITRARNYFENKRSEHLDGFPGLTWLFTARGGKSSLSFAWKALDRKLHSAVRSGDKAEVKSLLAKGADPNARDGTAGITPLMSAVTGGHIDIIKILLQDPFTYRQIEDNRGQTARDWATYASDPTIMYLFRSNTWIGLD